MAKWGIYCLVCDRLLWTMDKKPGRGSLAASLKDSKHAVTGKKPTPNDMLNWCGCKGGTAQQELVESDNVDRINGEGVQLDRREGELDQSGDTPREV